MKRIGLFTSGGDSPGMNACIRAVVRNAANFSVEVIGIKRGYQGMIENEMSVLDSSNVSNIIQLGGTILKTARSADFLTPEGRKTAYKNLQSQGIEGLVAIGGNGTYTGAGIFYEEYGIPTIGVPGTIDNDLYGTDYTIGFDTAVNTAVNAVDKIRDTADAHNRVFFVEVMGRDSGYIGMFSGIACGAEGIFIPEQHDQYQQIVEHFARKKRQKAFSIFIVSEGETEGNAYDIAKKFKEQFPDIDYRVSILGHIQRGGNPTANDRILASRLGSSAVKYLLEGKKSSAVGVINNETVLTSFNDAINSKKDFNTSIWEMAKLLTQ